MDIRYAMKSRPGDRPGNEDCIRMKCRGGDYLFSAADGLGSYGNGRTASETAVDSVFGRFAWDEDRENFLAGCMHGAQDAVLLRQKEDPDLRTMSTTLVTLLIHDGKAQWANIGDSRLYWFRKDTVAGQTVDHSVPQMLVDLGEITPEQIRKHPDRSRLLKTIGRPWDGEAYDLSREVKLNPGDAFLLCTDGFWEYIDEEQMCAKLHTSITPVQWLRRMSDIVKSAGEGEDMDNYSAICIFCG